MKPKKINKQNWKAATKYHVIKSGNLWKFRKVGAKRAICVCSDKSTLMTKTIYYLAWNGGYVTVHKENGEVDFILTNWFG